MPIPRLGVAARIRVRVGGFDMASVLAAAGLVAGEVCWDVPELDIASGELFWRGRSW